MSAENEGTDEPAELLRNLRELVAIDRAGGVQIMSRPERVDAAEPAQRSAPDASAAEVAAPAQPSLPDQRLADLPADGEPAARLAAIAERIAACRACTLCEKRQQTVPGEGAAPAELLFVGEGPGADEDRQGRPFVGAAGQLLDRMIEAMGLAREAVFIANVIKCRPPGNRTPEADEAAACLPFLEAQVDALRPTVICTLGNTPLRALSGNPRAGITRQRGQPFTWRGYTCVPTFHPSYLLRNEAGKKPAWEDLKQVLQLLGRELPKRGSS